MKARLFGAVLGVAFTASLTLSHVAVGQNQNYYIVVGAFSSQEDANDLTSFAQKKYLDSTFTDKDNVFQLHVIKTSSREAAISKTMQLQRQLNIPSKQNSKPEALNTYADASGSKAESSDASVSGIGIPLKPKGKYFKFEIATPDGNILPTQVHHIDPLKNKDIASYQTNDYVDILRPGKEMPMTMVAGVFGYKEVEKVIDYSDPSSTEGIYEDENGAWVIPYTLERLEKGDVSIMYNVAFHRDAVVMLPTSKQDLDALVNMMNENPNYVIKVHGHCNGKKARKITALGDTKNYFDTQGSAHFNGSAKMLTTLRADAIRSYLIDHGIDENRIKTFSWGGSYMLADENSSYARINDRIEIEILKD